MTGYGESQSYREGLYRTDEGYRFYPPDDEEEDDMAINAKDCVRCLEATCACGTQAFEEFVEQELDSQENADAIPNQN